MWVEQPSCIGTVIIFTKTTINTFFYRQLTRRPFCDTTHLRVQVPQGWVTGCRVNNRQPYVGDSVCHAAISANVRKMRQRKRPSFRTFSGCVFWFREECGFFPRDNYTKWWVEHEQEQVSINSMNDIRVEIENGNRHRLTIRCRQT